eukprot:2437172-Amphidinium_carterae.1
MIFGRHHVYVRHLLRLLSYQCRPLASLHLPVETSSMMPLPQERESQALPFRFARLDDHTWRQKGQSGTSLVFTSLATSQLKSKYHNQGLDSATCSGLLFLLEQ